MRKRKVTITDGVCKLTNKTGRFVDSHILPRALTILNKTGERALEASITGAVKKKLPGWYDNQLCIAEGEEILSKIDNAAIKILREHQLLWSGWGESITSLITDDREFDENNNPEGIGLRAIKNLDWKPVKLFILSLIWRAAASERIEMESVKLPSAMLEKLRQIILNRTPLTVIDFPIRLYQLGDKGIIHNRTPLIEEMKIELPEPFGVRTYIICRVYIDGLIAHITLNPDDDFLENSKSLLLGYNETLLVFIHKTKISRSLDDLLFLFKKQQILDRY